MTLRGEYTGTLEAVEREQAEREQAHAAGRATGRQGRESAHERHEGLTKAELAEELGQRDSVEETHAE